MSDQSEFGMDDDSLTPAERMAFESLPAEQEPSRLLEERTVKALRQRGLLSRPGATAADGPPRVHAGVTRVWRIGAAIAAAILLFASGLSVGQIIGARQTTDAVEAALGSPQLQEAMRVQRTGSDYVAALAALAESTSSEDSLANAQGVEVALTALWAAANEIVRLAPEDPLAAKILLEFDRARLSEQSGGPASELVIWN